MQPSTPALIRRQSLPESLLSSAQVRTFTQRKESEAGNDFQGGQVQLVTELNQKSSVTLDKIFKRSDDSRFGRHSKRKSQSLYESHEVKNFDLPKIEEESRFQEENVPMLTRNHSSPPGASMFSSVEVSPEGYNMEKEGKLSSDHEQENAEATNEGQVDGDLDFLIQQQYNSASASAANEDQKIGTPPMPSMFENDNSNATKRRSIHEVRGFPESFRFERGLAPEDAFHVNLASNVQSLPNFPNNYENLGLGLNNFPPITNMNAFHLNPLNNFGMYEASTLGGFGPVPGMYSPADSLTLNNVKSEIKKRRSRVPSSVYRGVSRCGKDNKFQARIRIHGKVKYLGRFKSEIEAAKCYDKHAVEHLGVNAQTNFPVVQPGQASAN